MKEIFVTGNAIKKCNYSTGHTVQSIAFFENEEDAQEIGRYIDNFYPMLEALKSVSDLYELQVPYGSDYKEDCLKMVRAAITAAEKE